jgi:acetyl-CoA C-acetyltransferase
MSGNSGMVLSRPLQLQNKPVTRVENFCATGSEALRGAAYAVASGAYDIAMAIGVEKVKDSGYQGLVGASKSPTDGTGRTLTAAAMFAMCAPAYGRKYGVDDAQMREVLAHISWKNHYNGARNPRAQFRKEVTTEAICNSPIMAGDLRVFDCSGVADGSAAVIVVRAEDASKYTDKPIYVKGLSFVAGNASGNADPDYDYTAFPEIEAAGRDAYAQAGVTDPRRELAMAEVHDCFTPAELLIMEDLGFAERGAAWKEVLAGTYDLAGDLPINPDGGLKSFGHPVGASGLRMLFEAWLQLRKEAPPERQIDTERTRALTHNLGGYPGEMVSFVGIVGSELG